MDLRDKKTEFHFAKIDGDLLMEFLGFLASPRGFEPPTPRLGVHRKATRLYVYNISLRLVFPCRTTLYATYENRFELTEFISVYLIFLARY